MNFGRKIYVKFLNYWIDDPSRDDFEIKRRALLILFLITPLSTLNEIYQSHIKVIQTLSLFSMI